MGIEFVFMIEKVTQLGEKNQSLEIASTNSNSPNSSHLTPPKNRLAQLFLKFFQNYFKNFLGQAFITVYQSSC